MWQAFEKEREGGFACEGNARGAHGTFPVVLATSLGSDFNYVGRECSTGSTGSAALEFIHFQLFFLYAPVKEF